MRDIRAMNKEELDALNRNAVNGRADSPYSSSKRLIVDDIDALNRDGMSSLAGENNGVSRIEGEFDSLSCVVSIQSNQLDLLL